LGFEVVNECKLLGFRFSNNQSLSNANKDNLIEKIGNVIRFWTPFNLSISGKITVAKSLMLPLFNYFATVISFEAEVLSQIEKKIEKFVTGGLNISKDKIYSAVDKGGINLFNLADFAMCLQAFWIKRASKLTHDNWRRQLINLNPAGVTAITTPDTVNCGPILKGILTNFIAFRNAYGTAYNNFIAVPVLYNNNFFFKRGGEQFLLTREFFFDNGAESKRLDALTWSMLTNNYVFFGFRKTNNALGLNLSYEKYIILKAVYESARKKFFDDGERSVAIGAFFAGIKKGSKRLRLMLSKSKSKSLKNKCPIKKYSETAGVAPPDAFVSRKLNARWNSSYYGSELRTFLFKLHHNTLGINSRVHHFNADRASTCTFCVLSKNLPAERETIQHFFWHCPTTNKSINQLLTGTVNFAVGQSSFFTGTDSNGQFNEVLCIIFDIIKFILWLHKIRRHLPTTHSITSDFYYFMGHVTGTNKKIELAVTDCNLIRRNRDE
jgi:hypothetical protein